MTESYIIDANNFSDADQNQLPKDSKAFHLLECKKLKLNIPETIILKKDSYDAYIRYGAIPSEIVNGMKEFIGAVSAKAPVLFAVRCGDKNKHKELPQSIINIGMTGLHEKHFPTEFMKENKILYGKQISGAAALLTEKPQNARFLDIDEMIRLPVLTQCISVIQFVYEALKQLTLKNTDCKDCSVILQRMVFGNLDNQSCYGTAYTRHPYTGNEMDYGQYMTQKQGVEANLIPDNMWKDMSELKTELPHIYIELKKILARIEQYYKDIRFVEFIVESGVLYFTQLSIRNRIYFPHIFEPADNQ